MKLLFFSFFIFASFFAWGQVSVDCDLTLITTIENFNVYRHNPSGVIMYKAKMYIDADGSPRAYGPNNSGLDWTANAGYPGNWWGVVTDSNGDPIIQGPGDPYPGMYVSTTSLVNSAYSVTNPLRYTNSETVPYYVLPSALVSLGGIRIGDVAYVYNTQTGQGCFAIYADTGPAGKLGEGSIYLAQQIGINSDPRTGGTSLGIIDYIVFPMSGYGQGTIPSIAQIDSIGALKIAAIGGTGITQCLEPMPADHTSPTTQINMASQWVTSDFVAQFSDSDNVGGSGIEKRFYNVSDFHSNEWRANYLHGFFCDNFNQNTIHPDWTIVSGTWTINTNNKLQQSNEALSNTNIYAPLTQNLSNRYLYHFKATMGGTGTSRRAGFHFFADQPDSSNRGNSYFVWFRLDDDKIQIYKVVNNSWGSSPVKDTAYNFTANQEFDVKIIYDRITGLIRVYINNVLSAQWVDTTPIQNGSYVSFRSANCNYQIDDFDVYRSRYPTANISIGSGNMNDIRYQNDSPAMPSGRIKSVVSDNAGNLSNIVEQLVNVDWTPPTSVIVSDGVSNDIDTISNMIIQANWLPSNDSNSGIERYEIAIGTTPFGNDVLDWTDNLHNLSVSVNTLTLSIGQTYYVIVRAKNNAGLYAEISSSDGQIYLTSQQIQHLDLNGIEVYPNPCNDKLHISLNPSTVSQANVLIIDAQGQILRIIPWQMQQSFAEVQISDLNEGTYFIWFVSKESYYVKKLRIKH
ncbi:MAG: T9SS type A sorting domain-containing protein [Bacteroidales bacterium]|nr:T9SS type A sorting domain-containing protein [Bacteroidales bacterium]